MQNKLAMWTEVVDQYNFECLLRLITNRSWLLGAAHITLAYGGAKTMGIDGVNKAMLESRLDQQLELVQFQLLIDEYKPSGFAIRL